jgi:hypothetical protein
LSGSYILTKKEQKSLKKSEKVKKKSEKVQKSPKKGVQSMIFWPFPAKFGKKTPISPLKQRFNTFMTLKVRYCPAKTKGGRK